MSKPKFKTSGFALLDVTAGRRKLAEHFRERPAIDPCPTKYRIPVVIYGYLDHTVSGDDGTSQEFAVIVENLKIGVSK